ncbi:hypothetical protein [Sphingomonas faeni]|uniref:hypothetical protein n=1 Tax=Sphingomonas faeni TaxID=185950 RepID=UPI00334863FE
MTYAVYFVGSPRRPEIRHDNGFLGRFPPRSPTPADRRHYATWQGRLELAEAAQGVPFAPKNDIPDALAAYRHFLTGRGAARTFSYERYVANDASGRTTLRSAILEAMAAAYDLHRAGAAADGGSFSFTGSAIGCGGTTGGFPYPATENWQKAIGAHSIWISGDVAVEPDVKSGTPHFTLTLVIHAEDRYNFNPGAADIATGIPDDENGVFEITGLAKQYMNAATLTRRVAWSGPPTTSFTVSMVPVLRQRHPADNRRLRNKL